MAEPPARPAHEESAAASGGSLSAGPGDRTFPAWLGDSYDHRRPTEPAPDDPARRRALLVDENVER